MASKIKVDQIQTGDGTGTIALQNQLSGMTTASLPALGSAQMPTGSVVQVAQSGSWSNASTTSTSFVDSPAFINFTPTSSSNKVLVTFSIGVYNTSSTSLVRGGIQLKRVIGGNPTIVWNSDGFVEQLQVRGSPAEVNMVTAGVVLDSPNTTSQVEYRIQMARSEGVFHVFTDTRGSKIVCQEIKG
tara:strand:- start:32 stop:589 length:558 start_codon:yes stop_codon:yes gene_type:complete